MSGEKLGSNNDSNDNDWYAPGLKYPSSEWAALNTPVPTPEAIDPTANLSEEPSWQAPGLRTPTSEWTWNHMSEAEQRENLLAHQKDHQVARETVDSIANRDASILEGVKQIAFDGNKRAEFMRDYHDAITDMINENRNDFSEAASQKVNNFVEDYCAVIMTMDNLQRENGSRLLDASGVNGEIVGEYGSLNEIIDFMRQRRKNGCNVDIAVPIKYSDENPHPKMDGVAVAVWLSQRLESKDPDTSSSTENLREQITTKLTGKSAYQRYQERMAQRNQQQ